jgi:hypothetical protein
VQSIDHGFGVVEFNGYLSVDQKMLFDYMEYLKTINTQALNHNNPNLEQKNEAGFTFKGNEISQAPSRYTKLFEQSNDLDIKQFVKMVDDWEKAIYKCLIDYCKIYPDAKTTIWWSTAGHIVGYSTGQLIGPHCDTQVAYTPGQIPENDNAVYNTLSCGLYLNECADSDDLLDDYNYTGGELYLTHPKLSYKPKNGGIILYPSNYIGRHEVKPVTSGYRYAYLKIFASGIPKNMDPKGLNWLLSLEKDVMSSVE